jgi:hypothetical protein
MIRVERQLQLALKAARPEGFASPRGFTPRLSPQLAHLALVEVFRAARAARA